MYYDHRMSLKYNERGDCVVHALSHSLDIPYEEARHLAKLKMNRDHREGTGGLELKRAFHKGFSVGGKRMVPYIRHPKTGDVNEVEYGAGTDFVIKKSKGEAGMTFIDFLKSFPKLDRIGIGRFARENPKGTFFCIVSRHAVVVKNGVVIDWAGLRTKDRRPVEYVWKVES